jgi:hypothetical protein
MTIQLGSPVLYKLQNGASAGEYRPAIITRTWGHDGKDPQAVAGTCVQLAIFLDGCNDRDAEQFASSSHYDDNTEPPGTWKWPSERVL